MIRDPELVIVSAYRVVVRVSVRIWKERREKMIS